MRSQCSGGSVSALVPGDQAAQVVRIESDRAAKVDGGELAALDESLDCPGMHVKKLSGLVGRQKSWSHVDGGDCRSAVVIDMRTRIERGAVACRLLSPRRERRTPRFDLRRFAELEEGELLSMNPHHEAGNLSVTRLSVNTG